MKPGNIIVSSEGIAKVSDFGIARLDGSDQTRIGAGLTQIGAVIGSPPYMSPEQVRSDTVDFRTDLFSTGVLLFELVTGHRPFTGRTDVDLMYRIVHGEPENAPEIVGRIPAAVRAVISRALQKAPQDRYETATAMARALEAAAAIREDRRLASTGLRAPPAERIGRLATSPGGISDSALSTIERWLAGHVGSHARNLLRTAASQAKSPEQFTSVLAANIGDSEQREQFRESTLMLLTGMSARRSPEPTAPPRVTDEELERVRLELAHLVGPIAGPLVQRAAQRHNTLEALRRELADHIDDPTERAAFLNGPRRR
jgi:serine/threonine-protein kinase